MSNARVYCAGPLFNVKEREEMEQIAGVLEARGLKTFLPQRDGLELTRCVEQLQTIGHSASEAAELISEAVFALDVYQVLHGCHVVVANLNGRVPDEGTVAEAAMAWARGKAVVGYKSDSRSAFAGEDNPLVSGLFDFCLCSALEDIAPVVLEKLSQLDASAHDPDREGAIGGHIGLGKRIWEVLERTRDVEEIVRTITGSRPTCVAAG